MTMQIVNLVQGSPEWHAHRAQHFNASDAPAMMGASSYRTRSELIKELATGITPEIDAVTQRRFDDGHQFEALARPLAEEIIGDTDDVRSAIRGHSMARDAYGNDAYNNGYLPQAANFTATAAVASDSTLTTPAGFPLAGTIQCVSSMPAAAG